MTAEEFPPKPAQEAEINAALRILASVVGGRTAVYVSSPLTTGQRAYEWHLENGGAQATDVPPEHAFREAVIAANREEASRYVDALRQERRAPVIDPTALDDLPGWTQSDYRFLWGRAIEDYAAMVIFRQGWQYSNGCSYEFYVSARAGLPLLAEDLSPLTVKKGRALVADAIAQRRHEGADTTFLENVSKSLEQLTRTAAER